MWFLAVVEDKEEKKEEKPCMNGHPEPQLPEKQPQIQPPPPTPEPPVAAGGEKRSPCKHQDIREKLGKEREKQQEEDDEEVEDEAYHNMTEDQIGKAVHKHGWQKCNTKL